VKFAVFDAQSAPGDGFCGVFARPFQRVAAEKRATGANFTWDIRVLPVKRRRPPGGGIPALRFAFAVVGCMEAFPANSEKDDMCSTDF